MRIVLKSRRYREPGYERGGMAEMWSVVRRRETADESPHMPRLSAIIGKFLSSAVLAPR